MTLQTVINNLNNTIEGKTAYRNSLLKDCNPVNDVMIAFLDINIEELIKIRNDLLIFQRETQEVLDRKLAL